MNFFSIRIAFLICFFIICNCAFSASAQTRIFNSSASAQPGEAISLQGNFSATAKAFIINGGSATALPILVQRAGHLTAQVPATLSLDLYQVFIEDQGQRSPSVYINQPQGMHFDSPEVGPGGPLRLFGRNLQLSGSAAQVRFQARNGGNSGVATVQASQSDAYSLRLTAPASLVPGVVYDVYITNGRGGSTGEVLVDQPITAIAAGSDYFQLGVGWAAKLNFTDNVYNVKTDSRLTLKAVGNGVANDKPAIQAAIDKAAAAGGGIVYLPEGTYKLLYSDWGGFYMKSRVIVQGAGKDKTFVKFGYDTPGYTAAAQAVRFTNGTYQSGLADLAMINVDNTGKWKSNLAGQVVKELVLQRVRFDLNAGQWLLLQGSDKVAIMNSDISQATTSLNGYRGPLLMDECTNFVVAGNTFSYAFDGLNLNKAHEGVFENNRVYRDGRARFPNSAQLINHVLILNFAENIAVLNNLLKVVNGPAQDGNDGEAIIAEGGGPDRIDEDAGTVSNATATTLQDNSKSWGSFRLKPVVAIVSGNGRGQWRTIISRSGNTLMLDRPWDVVPTSGAHYAIFNWGSRNWLLQGNTMEGNHRGITLYENAMTQVAIISNTLNNSGSIELSPFQIDNSGRGVPQEFLPMFNNQIIGNSVANTDGSNGVFIGVHTTQYIQPRTFGTSVIGLEVRRNTLTAGTPNIPAVVDGTYQEGFLNFLNFQKAGQAYVDEQEPAILGSIFQDNTAINCDNAVQLNSGSYNTLVCNTTLINSKILLQDKRIDALKYSSVGTVSCLQTNTAGLRTPENPTSIAAGLDYKVYEGSWDYLPDLGQLTPVKTGTTTDFDLTMRRREYGYVVRYTGYITVPTNGQYSFVLNSDDGSQLFIGSTLVVDNNQLGENERTGSIGLQAGTHAITVTYLQRGGAQILSVGYFGPGLNKQQLPIIALSRATAASQASTLLRAPENPNNTVAGLNYQHYEGTWNQLPNFNELTPVKTGTAATINLSTRTRDDYFASRYTGYIDIPADGEYTFYTSSDDGSQLFIGSTLVVDNNGAHGNQERSGKIGLQRGKHSLTVTFFEISGEQLLTASYEGPGIGKTQLPTAAIYRVAPASVPTSISGTTTSFYRAINLNGPAITLDGNAWEASSTANFSFSGNTFQNQQVPLNPSTDATRASMIRSSIWSGAPSVVLNAVPNGMYDVYLYLWEDNHPEIFSIKVESSIVLSSYNSGSIGTWKRLGPWRTTISDGTLNISTQGGAANLSGLEMWRVTSSSGGATTSAKILAEENVTTATKTIDTSDKLLLHPNPSSTQVFLATNNDDWTHVMVYDSYGAIHLNQERSQNSATIDVSSLSAGVYVVEVRLATGQLLRSKLMVGH
jgi:hypothetical protein